LGNQLQSIRLPDIICHMPTTILDIK